MISIRSNYTVIVFVSIFFLSGKVFAEQTEYGIQPGDVLTISVWKEPDLQSDVLVRPDGKFSFPLTGDVQASGRTVKQVRSKVASLISSFIPEPVVTVQVRQILGNKVYVIGKVNRPGEFPLVHDMDVLQALSVAGGMATFAAVNDIKILRRVDGQQSVTTFKYGEIEDGRGLPENILLQAGDVVVVP